MKSYILKPLQCRPGTTVRNGLPEIIISMGDDHDPVEWVKAAHPQLLVPPMCVELYDETRSHLLWESHPNA